MPPKAESHLTQETRFQAVIIAENFKSSFDPLTIDEPLVLLPLANTPLLHYSLDWLQRSGVDETIIYCHVHHYSEKIREHCKNWTSHGNSMSVIVIASEGCSSLGDAMRDLYSKSMLRSDFLMLSGDVIGNIDLKALHEKHKKIRDADKSVIMTCVYLQKSENLKHDELSTSINIIMNRQNGKMLHHVRPGRRNKLSIPFETLQHYPILKLYPNLRDPNIAICSEVIPSLFADNFDYGTRDSMVQGVIEQEDLLGYTIRGIILNEGFADRISSFNSYQHVSESVIKRFNYPFVPERSSSSHKIRYSFDPFMMSYYDPSASYNKKSIGTGVVVDAATNIHPNARIHNSVIGKHCEIGDGVVIRNSFVMNNVKIEANCDLDTCFIGNEVTLLQNVQLKPGVVLSSKVILGPDLTVPRGTRFLSHPRPDSFSQESIKAEVPDTSICGKRGKAYLYVKEEEENTVDDVPWGEERNSHESQEDIESTLSDAEASEEEEEKQDDISSDEEREQEFKHEVRESLSTAFNDKSAFEDVILEINSSRHAYNVSMEDVLITVIKGILSLGEESTNTKPTGRELWGCIKQSLNACKEIISHYIKKKRDQLILLKAIEEKAQEDQRYLPLVQNILHNLNQEMEALDDDIVIYWFEDYKEHTPVFPSIAKDISKFIDWLKASSEEDDDDD